MEHQLDAMTAVGVLSVCVVVGYRRRIVRRHLHGVTICRFVDNPLFAETNSLYSLWLARDAVQGAFLVVNGDVLAHTDIFRRLLAEDGCCLAYDSTSGRDDEHMKVAFDGGRLRRISKALGAAESHGENVGILKISAQASAHFFEVVGRLAQSRLGHTLWAPAALDHLALELPIRGIDVSDLPWTEIDEPHDLHRARNEVMPRLAPTPRNGHA